MLTAFGAGCATSIHFGKVPAAMPRLIGEFATELVWAGMVVSMMSLTLALAGMLAGGLGTRLGARRSAGLALATCGAASLLGASAVSLPWLLATRVVEGLGFTLAIVVLPSLINTSVTDRDRPLALGIWGAFMPAGFACMLMVSPWLIEVVGWRGSWVVAGAVTLLFGLLVGSAFRGRAADTAEPALSCATLAAVTQRQPLLMAGCFVLFTAQFLSVVSFFPVLLIGRYGLSPQVAALLGGIVVLGNVAGNPLGGWLLRTGLTARTIVMSGMGAMALTALLVFDDSLPLGARIVAALLFSMLGGTVPGALFANAPRLVERPSLLPAVMGLAMQGVGLGQFAGPIILGYTVDRFGWSQVPLFTVTAAALGVVLALGFGGRRRPPG